MLCEALVKNPKRITVFMNSGIGDTVVYIPSLQMLRAMYPDATICYLCNQTALVLYGQFNYADRYCLYEGNTESLIAELNGENLHYLTSQELCSLGDMAKPSQHKTQQDSWGVSDLLIMTERNGKLIKAALASRCKQVLSFCYARALYTPRLPFVRYFKRHAHHEIFGLQFLLEILDKHRFTNVFHTTDLKGSVLRASNSARHGMQAFLKDCGYAIKSEDPSTGHVPYLTVIQEESTIDSLTTTNVADDTIRHPYSNLIVINPNCISTLGKGYSYAPKCYIQLARDLAQAFPHILFVISSYGEQHYHSEEYNTPNLKLFINQGGLMNVIALLEQCDLLISPSTGPAHIADNIGRDIIGGYAYYDAIRWPATGIMQLAAKQKRPSIAPHKFTMHLIKKKVTNGIGDEFDEFYSMCRAYIEQHFKPE